MSGSSDKYIPGYPQLQLKYGAPLPPLESLLSSFPVSPCLSLPAPRNYWSSFCPSVLAVSPGVSRPQNHTEGTLVCAVFRVFLAWCVRRSAGASCASRPILSPSIWEVAQLAKAGVFTPQKWQVLSLRDFPLLKSLLIDVHQPPLVMSFSIQRNFPVSLWSH